MTGAQGRLSKLVPAVAIALLPFVLSIQPAGAQAPAARFEERDKATLRRLQDAVAERSAELFARAEQVDDEDQRVTDLDAAVLGAAGRVVAVLAGHRDHPPLAIPGVVGAQIGIGSHEVREDLLVREERRAELVRRREPAKAIVRLNWSLRLDRAESAARTRVGRRPCRPLAGRPAADRP